MRRWLLALLLATVVAAGGATASLPETSAAAGDPAGQMIALVNAARSSNGLPPLTVSPALATSAQSYATTMGTEGFFGHVGLDGSTLVTRDQAAGYVGWTYLAENLAAGQPTAQQAFTVWMADPSHTAAVLSAQAQETGVGFAQVPGSPCVYYWVEEFGARPALAHTVFLPFVASPSS